MGFYVIGDRAFSLRGPELGEAKQGAWWPKVWARNVCHKTLSKMENWLLKRRRYFLKTPPFNKNLFLPAGNGGTLGGKTGAARFWRSKAG